MVVKKALSVFGLVALLCISRTVSVAGSEQIGVTIRNNNILPITIRWIHPNSGERHDMVDRPLEPGGTSPLNTFEGHSFEIEEVCPANSKDCRKGQFTIAADQKAVVLIKKGLIMEHLDRYVESKHEEALNVTQCKEKAMQVADEKESMNQLLECVEGGIAKKLVKANEEIAFQAKKRKLVAESWENYTCADITLESSPSIEERVWHDADKDGNDKEYKVHVMHERPASKIHLIDMFITDEECEAMEQAAKPKLHKATVADGKGGSEYSDNRKAMQAGIRVPWKTPDHPIAVLSRRVYDYTNHVLGLDIEEVGQEDLMSIQYFGRGYNDTKPDRYMPHCDGECTGLPHKTGTRMATMVMYCDIPEIGGATNFRNSGIHVVPKRGGATFFSYIDPVERVMDSGFTEHSGCPVIQGEKKIVTQWIRLGVDKQNPWDSFNTLGIKRSDAASQ